VNVGGKELHYFDRFWNGHIPADFVERYHELFPRPESGIAGEWTPRYMYDHWSIRLLHEAAPDARILVILRDPIERFRSALAMRRRMRLGLGRILDEVASAVSRSAYAEQLGRVFDFFPREQVLVLQYERCVAEPVAEMERTCHFLGLEPVSPPPPELLEPRRPPNRKPELPPGIRDDLVARLGHDTKRVVDLCPEIDLSLWPSFRQLAREAPADSRATA
jgi:Sulfotransferase family